MLNSFSIQVVLGYLVLILLFPLARFRYLESRYQDDVRCRYGN